MIKVNKVHKMVDFIQTGHLFQEFPDTCLLEFSQDSKYVIEITLSSILTELLAICGPPPRLKWVFLDYVNFEVF